ncbi:PP5 [Symbiodinium natans]|uniref:PP5 protein n=1 Tax=Symbiodinium natans TaxID=878477 RepID=A0A812SHE1_9DINO|nr:PP5 [Symbiodinium natans]
MARPGRTSAVLGLGAAAALAPGFLLPAEPAPRQAAPTAAEASAPRSAAAAPRAGATPAVTVGLGVAAVAAARCRKAKHVRCSRVVRQAERALRPRDRADGHGWVKEDPDFDAMNGAVTATHAVELKKRPSGIKRYTHGLDGKGAMVMDMHEKARYPGDPQGQAAVAGVKKGFVVKAVNGQDVRSWDFEDIMDLLEDFIPDPDVQSTAAFKSGEQRVRKHQAARPLVFLTAV